MTVQHGKWLRWVQQLAHNMEQKDLHIEYIEAYAKTDKRLALLEQQITVIKENHLTHIEKSIENINTKFNWAVGVVFVQLIGIIVYMMMR
jgi:hypothetical protein